MDQDRNSKQVKKLCTSEVVAVHTDEIFEGYATLSIAKKRALRFFLSSVFNKFKVAKPIVPNLNFGKQLYCQYIFKPASHFRHFVLHSGQKQAMLLSDA